MTRSADQTIKGAHELVVFTEFVHAAGLSFDMSTVSSRDPPEPDIEVVTSEGKVYFELGRLLDKGMQKAKLHALKGNLVSTGDFDVRLPEREMLLRKLAKAEKYETNGAPIDLLLYYDNEDLIKGDVPAVGDFARHADHVMKSIVSGQFLFRCIWVYERHHQTVLWKGSP